MTRGMIYHQQETLKIRRFFLVALRGFVSLILLTAIGRPRRLDIQQFVCHQGERKRKLPSVIRKHMSFFFSWDEELAVSTRAFGPVNWRRLPRPRAGVAGAAQSSSGLVIGHEQSSPLLLARQSPNRRQPMGSSGA